MTRSSTIRIWYENLHVSRVRYGGGADLSPLSSLSAGDHIHGRLRLEVSGLALPRMGYAGDLGDEACFQAWPPKLQGVANAFRGGYGATCLDGECEQGQPAFLFERSGERGFLSIVDSILTDGKADPTGNVRSSLLTSSWLHISNSGNPSSPQSRKKLPVTRTNGSLGWHRVELTDYASFAAIFPASSFST